MKHLDEGTIHAWLDGELRNDVQDVERHVAECTECAARVAEARGLIAGASRILSALDDVGDGIVPRAEHEPQVAGAGAGARARAGVRPVRVVAWLAAAGLLFTVGVKTLGRSGVAPSGSAVTDVATPTVAMEKAAPPKPTTTQAVTPAPTQVAAGAGAATNRPAHVDSSAGGQANAKSAPAPASARADASAPQAMVAPPAPPVRVDSGATARVSGDSIAAAMRARMQGAEMHLNAVVVTSAAAGEASSARPAGGADALGRIPVCVSAMPMAPETSVVSAAAPASGFTMFDTTRRGAVSAAGDGPRLVRDASGVVGEWVRVGADSLVVRSAGRELRAAVLGDGVVVGGRVLGWKRCPP